MAQRSIPRPVSAVVLWFGPPGSVGLHGGRMLEVLADKGARRWEGEAKRGERDAERRKEGRTGEHFNTKSGHMLS